MYCVSPVNLRRLRLRRYSTQFYPILVAMFCAGCVSAPPSPGTTVTPIAVPNMARVWIYREYEPSQGLARPYVRINGMVAAISEPGGSFYRDVPAGSYHISVDTDGRDVNQFADIAVAAGQTVFVKVEASRQWEGDLVHTTDTFYTQVIPPAAATAELAHIRSYGGG
jgi:hypothetical protein